MGIPLVRKNFKYIKGKNLRDLVEHEYILKNNDVAKLIRVPVSGDIRDDPIMVVKYDINDKKNLEILERARKDLLVILFRRFIDDNFGINNIKEATIVFHGNWTLPLYIESDNYFGIPDCDDPLDIMLPMSLGDYTTIEFAVSLIEIIDNDNRIARFTGYDILDGFHNLIIERPMDFPTYENLDDCIVEYNYFHNDTDTQVYRLSKAAKIIDGNVYFYNQKGELIDGG